MYTFLLDHYKYYIKKIDKKVKKMSLEKKIKWYFEHIKKEINAEDLDILKIGFFDNDGNIVFKKTVVKWRDFREFLDK